MHLQLKFCRYWMSAASKVFQTRNSLLPCKFLQRWHCNCRMYDWLLLYLLGFILKISRHSYICTYVHWYDSPRM
jgi:hypothetical protein